MKKAKCFVSLLLLSAMILSHAGSGFARNADPSFRQADRLNGPQKEGKAYDVDQDGDTDEDDALAILDYLTGETDDAELDLEAGDADGDEIPTTYDAYLILKQVQENAGQQAVRREPEALDAAEAGSGAEPGTFKLELHEETASHNGLIAVVYDPERMAVQSLSSEFSHCSWRDDAEKGVLTFAYAGLDPAEAGENFAEIIFAMKTCEGAGLEITTLERNSDVELNEVTALSAAAGHAWKFQGFTWTVNNTAGYTGAAAGYKCAVSEDHEAFVEAHFDAERTEPTLASSGSIVYTAWVTAEESLDGAAHTESKTVILPALEVTYSLNMTSLTLAVKSSEQLKLVGSDGSAGSAAWTSSDPSAADVDENGLVTALKYHVGPVTVHAVMANGFEADCAVQTLFWDAADSSKYYFRHVYWAAEKGITRGYDLEYFGVDMDCERQDFILFIYRLAGQPAVSSSVLNSLDTTFSDVSELKASFRKAIAWGYSKGIIKGYTTGENKGKFGVGFPITRREAMIMLWRYAGKPAPPTKGITTARGFTDVKGIYQESSDSFRAIAWAAGSGIANGYTNASSLPPDSGLTVPCYGANLPCKREQMITFLSRYAEKFMKE